MESKAAGQPPSLPKRRRPDRPDLPASAPNAMLCPKTCTTLPITSYLRGACVVASRKDQDGFTSLRMKGARRGKNPCLQRFGGQTRVARRGKIRRAAPGGALANCKFHDWAKPSGMSVYAFGPFILDTAGRRLTRDGERLAVPGKAWQILLMLAEAGGHLVSHDTFRARLWPNIVVEDRTLTVHMST